MTCKEMGYRDSCVTHGIQNRSCAMPHRTLGQMRAGGPGCGSARGGAGKAASETGDPLLLTPGPLTTAKATKEAMMHDYGSRDPAFIAITAKMREQIHHEAPRQGQTIGKTRTRLHETRDEAAPASRHAAAAAALIPPM